MTRLRDLGVAAATGLLVAACSRQPPRSVLPTARDAIDRMRASTECARGVGGEASVDWYEGRSRVKGKLLFLAMLPSRLRLDAYSPFGAVLSTLTSGGAEFELYDVRERAFLYGPADACNIERFTAVPVPVQALVELLLGRAPVLAHEPGQASIDWSGGQYVLTIHGAHQATEVIRLRPLAADWDKPWAEQRINVTGVSVEQAGVVLYEAELGDHREVSTAKPRLDAEGLDPPIPPSGPECDAEAPMSLRLLVPGQERDLLLRVETEHHNPPLVDGVFRQLPPPGAVRKRVSCGR